MTVAYHIGRCFRSAPQRVGPEQVLPTRPTKPAEPPGAAWSHYSSSRADFDSPRGANLTKLNAFCQQNGLDPECGWYERAIAALAS